jgi:rhodanese-related sulfurtransferase
MLFNRAPANPNALTAADAVSEVSTGNVVVVDVRDPSEISKTGMAAGAINLPLATLRMQADPGSPECHPSISSDKKIAVYCASGARSHMAAQLMGSFGLDAHNIGGLGDWMRAGGTCR